MNQSRAIFSFFLIIFMENVFKKIREIDLFDLTSFFGVYFFRFSGPLCESKFKFLWKILKFFFREIDLFDLTSFFGLDFLGKIRGIASYRKLEDHPVCLLRVYVCF